MIKCGLLSILMLLGLGCVNLIPVVRPALGITQRDSSEVQFPKTVPFPIPTTWRGMVPLCTVRSEAERILGQPKSSEVLPYIYENETERVDVLYSAGRCAPETGRWDVPINVLITIDVYPKKTLLLEDLIFDKRKYVRQEWSHPQDWVTYRNKEEGISIETTNLGGNTEEVRSVKYGPKTTNKALKCKE